MDKLKTVKAALLGFGTVGGGVYKLVEMRRADMPHTIGADLEIAKVLVRSKEKVREGVPAGLLTTEWKEIIEDDTIRIVIELIGGIEPAKTYILDALKAGKNVVTANKDLLAEHGEELLDTAARHGVDLLFEASVAGAIPIIRPLKQCLAGNEMKEVMGIVNGTTNFILTKMADEGMEFDEALAEATRLGYAEADPTADVEGFDAGRKMAIMASIAFHSRVTFREVYTEGISKISAKDIQYAKEMGCVIKLLGVASCASDGIEVRVHPMLIPDSHPLAAVKDSFNAVFIQADAADDVMFYGRGAGELPTASAVLGDIIDTARNIMFGCTGRILCSCYKKLPVKKIEDIKSRYFLRMQVEDQPGVLADIAGVFGRNQVSIAQLIQKTEHKQYAELVVITDTVLERNLNDALALFGGMSVVRKIPSIIRVYHKD